MDPSDPLTRLVDLAGDDFQRRLELERLRLEGEKLRLEARRSDRNDRWLVRLFPVVVTAAVSLVGVAISIAQVWSANISRDREQSIANTRYEQERAAAAINAERQWRMTVLNVVTQNFDRIVSKDAEQRSVIRATLSAALTDSLAQRVFSAFALATQGEVSSDWQAASRQAEARIEARRRRARQLIENLFAPDPSVRRSAGEEIIRDWRSDPAFAAQMIAYARQHPENPDGVYNTVAMLGSMEPSAFPPGSHALAFLREAEANGSKTRELSRQLQRRLLQV